MAAPPAGCARSAQPQAGPRGSRGAEPQDRRCGGPGAARSRWAREASTSARRTCAFTKGFDRIKFPLAIACMLGLFLVLVIALRARRELTGLEREYGVVYSEEDVTRRGRTHKRVLFNGYLGTLVNARDSSRGWFATERWFPTARVHQAGHQAPRDAGLQPARHPEQHFEDAVHRSCSGSLATTQSLRLSSGFGALVRAGRRCSSASRNSLAATRSTISR